MLTRTLLLSAAALSAPASSSAFPPPAFAPPRRATATTTASSDVSAAGGTTTSLSALPDPSSLSDALHSASVALSTIDADIDSIPTDQFGLVFAGGLVVMAGGLVSALAVGAILEGGNNYANVIADSYVQGGDESFWESLTPEQREETEKLMKKLKDSKGEGEGGSDSDGEVEVAVAAATAGVTEAVKSEPEIVVATANAKTTEKSKEERSMFSDYD